MGHLHHAPNSGIRFAHGLPIALEKRAVSLPEQFGGTLNNQELGQPRLFVDFP